MSLNRLQQNQRKPFLNPRAEKFKADDRYEMKEIVGAPANNDADFASIYPRNDQNLYYRDVNNQEYEIAIDQANPIFIAVDANAHPNQKRIGDADKLTVGLNSDIESVSTSMTGPALVGLAIGSESNAKYANFLAVKHQDANEQGAYVFARSRGDEATPTQVKAGDGLGILLAVSYNNNNSYEANGFLQWEAVTDQTAINSDGRLAVYLTSTGSILPQEKFVMDQDASFAIRESVAPALKANFGKIYVKSADSQLYFKDSAGVEYLLTGAGVVDTLQEVYDNSASGNLLLDPAIGGLNLQNDALDSVVDLFKINNNADTVDFIRVRPDYVALGNNAQCTATGVGNLVLGADSLVADAFDATEESTAVGHNCIVSDAYNCAIGTDCEIINNNVVQTCEANVCLGYENRILNDLGSGIITDYNIALCIGNAGVNPNNASIKNCMHSFVAGRQEVANVIQDNNNTCVGKFFNTDASGSQANFVYGANCGLDNASTGNVICGWNYQAGTSVVNSGFGVVGANPAYIKCDNANRCLELGINNSFVNTDESLIIGHGNNVLTNNSIAVLGKNIDNSGANSIAMGMPTLTKTNANADAVVMFAPDGYFNFEADDDRNASLNSGNLQKFCRSGDVAIAGPTQVIFSVDTTQFRLAGNSNAIHLKARTMVFRSDADENLCDYIQSNMVGIWNDTAGTLTALPIVNNVLIAGSYGSAFTWAVNVDALEFSIPADGVNDYHFVTNIDMMVCNN